MDKRAIGKSKTIAEALEVRAELNKQVVEAFKKLQALIIKKS